MRVISGEYRGKKLLGQDLEKTRPTKDRTKESIFAIIQEKIKGSIFLDLFAGTGAIGIEALSNNAKKVYFNEINAEPLNILKKNLKGIKTDYQIKQLDYAVAIKSYAESKLTFDIIYLDPPYGFRSIDKLLRKIKEYKLLADDGIIIFETDKSDLSVLGYLTVNKKKYGKSYVYFIKNKSVKQDNI